MTTVSWNHSICEECWKARAPGLEPVRIPTRGPERCCYCGKDNESGIWVRENPRGLSCRHSPFANLRAQA